MLRCLYGVMLFLLVSSVVSAEEAKDAEMYSMRLDRRFIFPTPRRIAFGINLFPTLHIQEWQLKTPVSFSFDFVNFFASASGGATIQYTNYVFFANYHHGYNPHLDNYRFQQGWDAGMGVVGDVDVTLRYFNGFVRPDHLTDDGTRVNYISLAVKNRIFQDVFTNTIDFLHVSVLGRAIGEVDLFYQGYFQIDGSFFSDKLLTRAMVGYIYSDEIVRPEFYVHYYLHGLGGGQAYGVKLAAVYVEGRYYPFEMSGIPILSSCLLFVFLNSGGVLRSHQEIDEFATRLAGGVGIGYDIGIGVIQVGASVDDAAIVQFYFNKVIHL